MPNKIISNFTENTEMRIKLGGTYVWRISWRRKSTESPMTTVQERSRRRNSKIRKRVEPNNSAAPILYLVSFSNVST